MALFVSLVSVAGIVFVIRTLQVFFERGLIRPQVLMKVGISSLVVLISCPILAQTHSFFAFVLLTAMLSLCFLLVWWIERNALTQLNSRLPMFLDVWILNLKMGSSLAAARERALERESDAFQALLRPIFAATASQNAAEHPFLVKKVVHELKEICHATHSGLVRLETLRRFLKQDAEFRRKSGQAVRQTNIQAIMMLILLFALSIFSVNRYGWRQCGDLILISTAVSLCGVWCMKIVARKSKWKI
jgi:hypothetical protein